MGKRIDVTGQRYGKLLVLSASRLANDRWGCVCSCDCGATCTVDQGHLRSGNTTSCGCHKRSVLPTATTKHGHGREGKPTKTYRSWKAMRNRCNNPNTQRYKDYGGRGITVCPQWNEYTKFLADMGECPTGMSLDRVDTEGDYEPSNCRWATAYAQNNNQRSNRLLTCNGVTMTLTQLAKHLNVPVPTLHARLKRGALITTDVVAAYGETIHYEVIE